MKKLLYISVNSKPEEKSTSKQVARELINKIKETEGEVEVEEFDVYKEHIPTLTDDYFCGRNEPCHEEDYDELNHRSRNEVNRMKAMAEQFKEADIYVVASPMWSLFFPAPFKQYLDCVIQNGVTIKISEKEFKGLLGDKDRVMYLVQSSGGHIPLVLKGVLDHGSSYLKDISKAMGIKRYKEILVDGTGFTEEEREEAIEDAKDEINCMFKVNEFIGKAYEAVKEKKEKREKSFVYKIGCCHHKKQDEEEIKEKEEVEEETIKEETIEEEGAKAYSENNNKENEEIKEEEIKENNEADEPLEKEELTKEKIETYEKIENDNPLNGESIEGYDKPV
ncbi:MAG: FMN-dependent NADH-azoreductase [Sarcina sp.]